MDCLRRRAVSLLVFLFACLASSNSAFAQNTTCEAILAECLTGIDNGSITECPTLPFPAAELPAQVRTTQGYNLIAIRDGMWAYWDGLYFSLIVKSGSMLVLIDSPNTAGTVKTDGSKTRVTDAAEEVLAGEVPTRIAFWYSHPHTDHIGSAGNAYNYLKAKYPKAWFSFSAGEGARRDIEQFKTVQIPEPTYIGSDRAQYSYGPDLQFQVMTSRGHTWGDLIFYFPPSGSYPGFVYAVDVVVPGAAPFFYFAYTRNFGDYMRSHEQILELDFDKIVGGHLYRVGTRKDVEYSLQFAKDVFEATLTVFDNTSTAQVLELIGGIFQTGNVEFGNAWAGLNDFLGYLNKVCYRTVIAKYGCVYGSVEAMLLSACVKAVQYVRIQY